MAVHFNDNPIIVANNIIYANTYLTRLKGLMGRKALPQDTGLLLEPCDSVHTFHMKFSIDVIFLNDDNKVVHIEHNMKPNQLGKRIKGARKVLEINAGSASAGNIQPGDVIELGTEGREVHETNE